MDVIKENCLETQAEFDLAFAHHATQFEICSRLDAGGYTPDVNLVKYALSKTKNILVMIRNRFDYQANEQDLRQLLADINLFNDLPIQGYVLGHLTEDNLIDIPTTKALVQACNDKETVFNMAFDLVVDWKKAIDQLVNLGVTRILTKGGNDPQAINNMEHLKELKAYANGRIQLIVGGKVTDDNYETIAELTQIDRYHGRKLGIK